MDDVGKKKAATRSLSGSRSCCFSNGVDEADLSHVSNSVSFKGGKLYLKSTGLSLVPPLALPSSRLAAFAARFFTAHLAVPVAVAAASGFAALLPNLLIELTSV